MQIVKLYDCYSDLRIRSKYSFHHILNSTESNIIYYNWLLLENTAIFCFLYTWNKYLIVSWHSFHSFTPMYLLYLSFVAQPQRRMQVFLCWLFFPPRNEVSTWTIFPVFFFQPCSFSFVICGQTMETVVLNTWTIHFIFKTLGQATNLPNMDV